MIEKNTKDIYSLARTKDNILDSDYVVKCRKIFDHFGASSQRMKACEELGELSSAIMHGDRQKYLEERADVLIMLQQMDAMYDVTKSEGYEQIDFKLNRTLARYNI